jgi:hypothetical protein
MEGAGASWPGALRCHAHEHWVCAFATVRAWPAPLALGQGGTAQRPAARGAAVVSATFAGLLAQRLRTPPAH